MKAGFAVLVGRSNVGKSTLLNALVGTKIAITSPKPQTTRVQVHGIVHDPRGQIVFVDTPGIFERPIDRLTKSLNQQAKSALHGIDIVVYVVDPTRAIGNEEHIILRLLETVEVPKILVINKIDLRDLPFASEYEALADRFDLMLRISGMHHKNLKPLLDAVFERLPEGQPFYPEFQYTNLEHKQWVAELIREKLFIQLPAELPYGTSVELDEMEEKKDKEGAPLLYIKARILTATARHKSMIIGKEARKIKEIGGAARKELEAVLQKKVFLDLTVEVDERWMDRI